MDLRPQAHEIIRTWTFSTMVRAHLEFQSLPWTDVALSGWILDPDRKKMAKSKGNVVTPIGLLEQYGSDAMRYWAASARPGTDTAFDDGQMRIGRKLAIKLLNVSRFVLGIGDGPVPPPSAVTDPLDQAMAARLAAVVHDATVAFEAYDYARALERTEAFFWWFCDDYVELVKGRAYRTPADDGSRSARAALHLALDVLQRLLAPILPFATEEVWSWWQEGSDPRGVVARCRRPWPPWPPGPTPPRWTRSSTCWPPCARPRRRPRCRCGRRWPRCGCRSPCPSGRRICATPAASTGSRPRPTASWPCCCRVEASSGADRLMGAK